MNNQTPIKVMIVDDHPVVRAGIKYMLSVIDDMTLVGEADSGQDLLNQIRNLVPDVILMDMVMPHLDGLEATQAVLAQYPDIKIVVVTTFPKGDDVQKVLDSGAVGYLTKHSRIDVLADAIRKACDGQIVVAPEATTALMKSRQGSSKLGHDLTKREIEILALIAEGLANREIALQLKISPETVKHHISKCMSKLEASNRTQAAILAYELKLIPRSKK